MSVVPLRKLHDHEAVVLAGIFHGVIAPSLSPKDFSSPAWASVYKAIQKASAAGRPSLAVVARMVKLSEEQIWLLDQKPSALEAQRSLAELKKANLLQKIKFSMNSILSGGNPEKFLSELQDAIRLYTEAGDSHSLVPAGMLLDAYLSQPGLDWGVLYGFKELDAWTLGMHPGNLIIIAGRPGTGKTTLAVQIAARASITRRVAFFSVEVEAEQILEKVLCSLSGSTPDDIRASLPRDLEIKIRQSGLLINDSPAQTPDSLYNACRSVMECGGLDLVVIDYLQLLRLNRRCESRQAEIEEISRSLKQMARELKVPVVALSQLSRDSVRRGEPSLIDLRGSGALEQDADAVVFIHHEGSLSKLILAKNRNGPTGAVDVVFRPECSLFEEYEEPPF
ncbi:MAG: replicative helicase [Thermacetogenium sp.]|nr:replicative helicase [Thermacetogenium sp.]